MLDNSHNYSIKTEVSDFAEELRTASKDDIYSYLGRLGLILQKISDSDISVMEKNLLFKKLAFVLFYRPETTSKREETNLWLDSLRMLIFHNYEHTDTTVKLFLKAYAYIFTEIQKGNILPKDQQEIKMGILTQLYVRYYLGIKAISEPYTTTSDDTTSRVEMGTGKDFWKAVNTGSLSGYKLDDEDSTGIYVTPFKVQEERRKESSKYYAFRSATKAFDFPVRVVMDIPNKYLGRVWVKNSNHANSYELSITESDLELMRKDGTITGTIYPYKSFKPSVSWHLDKYPSSSFEPSLKYEEETSLHWAARYGRTQTVLALIEKGANVNAADQYNNTPLHLAIREGHTDTALVLIEKGANIDATDEHGYNTLHLAAKNGHTDMVKDESEDKKLTSIMLAIEKYLDINKEESKYFHDFWGKHYKQKLTQPDQPIHFTFGKLIEEEPSLHWAAENGHTEIVKELIKSENIDLNATDSSGKTPLILAISNGHTDTTLALIEKGANIDITDEHGYNTLHLAAENGQTEIVIELIKSEDIDLNATDSSGKTPLILAISNGHTDTALALIENGANIDATDEHRDNALHWAAQNGHTDIVLALIENSANVHATNKYHETPMHWAALNGHTDIVLALIQSGANVNSADNSVTTPLYWAAKNGHKDIVLSLIENGAKVDPPNRRDTPLHWAALNGQTETAKALIENGANVNATNDKGETPLHWAALNGHRDTALALIENGANVHATERFRETPLHWASKNGHKDIVLALIENGAKVDPPNCHETPLLMAAQNGHTDTALALIKKRANVNVTDFCWGKTPLQYAINKGDKDVVLALIWGGARDTYSVLNWAVRYGHTEIALALIKKRADVMSPDGAYTSLHLAAKNGHKKIVLALIENGATIDEQSWNSLRETPLQLAISNNKHDVAESLIQAGAKLSMLPLSTKGYRLRILRAKMFGDINNTTPSTSTYKSPTAASYLISKVTQTKFNTDDIIDDDSHEPNTNNNLHK